MTLPDLVTLAREIPAEELPSLAGLLAQAETILRMRVATAAPTPGNGRPAQEPESSISPERAAVLAGLPMTDETERKRSMKRLYAWAKGKAWASNPTGRYLRIHERRFQAWLATRRA